MHLNIFRQATLSSDHPQTGKKLTRKNLYIIKITILILKNHKGKDDKKNNSLLMIPPSQSR